MKTMMLNASFLLRLSQRCRDNLEVELCHDFVIVATPSRQFSTQCVEIVLSLRAQFDKPKIVQALSAQSGVSHFKEIVAALRRQSESRFLSLAPGFSQVSDARAIEKPFQRFHRAGGKPLKRFARCGVASTRLKPGANERLERDGIHVASYVTKLIPKKQLERKLHEAVRLARARLEEGRKL